MVLQIGMTATYRVQGFPINNLTKQFRRGGKNYDYKYEYRKMV